MDDWSQAVGTRRAITWAALVAALAVVVNTAQVWAQGAGCGGAAMQISSLDNLLKTAWEYLTSGAVMRIMAAAFILGGVVGIVGRRAAVAVFGFLAGAVTAFVPAILDKLIQQNAAAALRLCS